MLKKCLIIVSVSLVLLACLKRDEYSNIPVIKYKSMWKSGNSLVIQFSFTDGNGDIGLKDDETYFPFGPCDKFYKNLIIDPYRMKNGEFILARKIVPSDCSPDTSILWDTVGYDQRIKYLVPETKDKTLQGEIEVTLNEVLDEFQGDTIKFRLILIDRELNKSKPIETDVIIVPL